MTVAGGIGRTLPYLIPDFWTATAVAAAAVVAELGTIAPDPGPVTAKLCVLAI